MTLPPTIDTHAHYFPESYIKLIADHGKRCGTTVTTDSSGTRFIQVGLALRTGPITQHFFDLDHRIRTMDSIGVKMHALSLTQPMVYWADDELGLDLCIAFNDAISEAHRKYPDRFIGFAWYAQRVFPWARRPPATNAFSIEEGGIASSLAGAKR